MNPSSHGGRLVSHITRNCHLIAFYFLVIESMEGGKLENHFYSKPNPISILELGFYLIVLVIINYMVRVLTKSKLFKYCNRAMYLG